MRAIYHCCPACRVERADYEGEPGRYLPTCPNCGSDAAPVATAGSREVLARLLWAEIAGSGQRQRDVAETVGVTEKHLSTTINGRGGMSLDLVDRIFAACGRRLVLSTEPVTEGEASQP